MFDFGSFIRAEKQAIEAFKLDQAKWGRMLNSNEAAFIWIKHYEEEFKEKYLGEHGVQQLPKAASLQEP